MQRIYIRARNADRSMLYVRITKCNIRKRFCYNTMDKIIKNFLPYRTFNIDFNSHSIGRMINDLIAYGIELFYALSCYYQHHNRNDINFLTNK